MPARRRPRDGGPGGSRRPLAPRYRPPARARGAGGSDGRGSSRAPERQLPGDAGGFTRKSACVLPAASPNAYEETLSTYGVVEVWTA